MGADASPAWGSSSTEKDFDLCLLLLLDCCRADESLIAACAISDFLGESHGAIVIIAVRLEGDMLRKLTLLALCWAGLSGVAVHWRKLPPFEDPPGLEDPPSSPEPMTIRGGGRKEDFRPSTWPEVDKPCVTPWTAGSSETKDLGNIDS